MEYYVISPNVWNNGNFSELLNDMKKEKCVLMGWKETDLKGKTFSEMKKGDCVVVAKRKNWIWHYYFMGTVKTDDTSIYKNAQCKYLDAFIDLTNCTNDFLSNWTTAGSNQIPAIGRIKKNDNGKIIDFLKEKLEKGKKMENLTEIVALLRKKKNIILQGAPGTGKTYTTAEIALSILGKDITQYETHEDLMKDYENLLIKIDDSGIITSGQIGFVTFHQSMDYEDFVEGIKPKTEGDGIVTYNVEDGIFKAISNKAKYRKYRSFSDAYTNFINDIRDKYSDKNPLKIKTRTDSYFAVTVNSNNNLTLYTGENFSKQGSLTKENILKQINGEEKYKGWDGYFCGVIDYLSSKYGYKDEQESQMPYVLIIDEINRGNVSKIFGELITLLEADKRTEGNHPLSVTLPYSKEKFEIPSNLYIIGTMNTTDRSVGNIDYAVRRRFSFVTLESERSVVLAKNNGDEKSLAVQLFDSVMKFLTKNRTDMDIDDLMVGHSYFLADDENELKIKWKYDILPLLREYCKDGITKKDVNKNCSIQEFIDSQNEQN